MFSEKLVEMIRTKPLYKYTVPEIVEFCEYVKDEYKIKLSLLELSEVSTACPDPFVI
jgi:hypothetical protein